MKFAQEVRNRRIAKLEEKREYTVDSNVRSTFIKILEILDKATDDENFDGIKIYAGDNVYKEFNIKPDGFYQFNKKLISFKNPVSPIDFQFLLKIYVSDEEGYIVELSKYSPHARVLYINILWKHGHWGRSFLAVKWNKR